MKRAFTLIELMIVLTIIALAASLAAPAISSVVFSRQQTKAVETFDSLLTVAHGAALSNFTRTALRIERAFETDEEERMVKDGVGNPKWLPHQQARLLVFGNRRPGFEIPGERWSYRQLADTGTTPLPRLVWLAPDYALFPSSEANQNWQPAAISRLDTFYVAFSRQGELMSLASDGIVYLDETQGGLFIHHPDPSARAAVAYDRQALEQQGGNLAQGLAGIPLYVTRYTGSTVAASQ